MKKWYFSAWTLIITFIFVGPFMLPLVWANPNFGRKTKIIISAVVVILTILITLLFAKLVKWISDYYNITI